MPCTLPTPPLPAAATIACSGRSTSWRHFCGGAGSSSSTTRTAPGTACPPTPTGGHPPGLLTTRQLRARGLRPGGQDIAAQILWRRGKRVAYLYREDLAKPKRQATPAQLAAIDRALRARRTCPACGTEKPYCIPRSTGECNDCTAGGTR